MKLLQPYALGAVLVLCLCCASSLVAAAGKDDVKTGDDLTANAAPHVPSQVAIELHHSLHRPLDQSQVYWNFGGSTVLTKNGIRLTPASQNRRGWLWNDYPIESNNFEIEFSVEVASKPHFGGDGFGFWLLDGVQDPTYHNDPQYLNGNVFGLKQDFKGMGVVFDIYDNDGKRDNPSIFVLYNPEGTATNYNHDNDYADDMYKVVPSATTNPAYSCTANIRNLGHAAKVMAKFLHSVLHVYIDTDDGLGYKFCLAVKFDKPNAFKDHHIAFTAHTGQVADAHDIVQLSTRYLSDKEKDVADDHLLHLEEHPKCPTTHFLFWTAIVFGGVALILMAGHQLYTFKQMESADINPVLVCGKMNGQIVPHFGLHFGVVLLLLLGFQWQLLAFNLPLVAWRVYQIVRNQHLLNPAALDREKIHGQKGIAFATGLIISLVCYVFCQMFYLYRWFTC